MPELHGFYKRELNAIMSEGVIFLSHLSQAWLHNEDTGCQCPVWSAEWMKPYAESMWRTLYSSWDARSAFFTAGDSSGYFQDICIFTNKCWWLEPLNLKGQFTPKKKILSLFIHPAVVCFEDLWGTNNTEPLRLSKKTKQSSKSYFRFHRRKKVIQFGTKHEGEVISEFSFGEWHYAVDISKHKSTPQTCFWEILAFKGIPQDLALKG